MTKEEKREKQRMYVKRYWHTPKGQKQRNDARKRYYDKTRFLSDGKRRRWNADEVEILVNFKGYDEELAHELSRSVKSIQMKRLRLRKKGVSL